MDRKPVVERLFTLHRLDSVHVALYQISSKRTSEARTPEVLNHRSVSAETPLSGDAVRKALARIPAFTVRRAAMSSLASATDFLVVKALIPPSCSTTI